MEQWTAQTKAIIDKHCKDFSVTDFDSKMKAYGGYDKYVVSLGGVFAECHGKTDKVTTVTELRKRLEYAQGLMAIWGVDYNNAKTYWRWGCGNGSTAASDAFRKSGRGKCASGDLKKILGTSTIVTTNCNYGVDTAMEACGYSMWSCNFARMLKNGSKLIRSKKDLRPGDLVNMFSTALKGNDPEKWDNWRHIAIVHTIEDGKIWMADFGNRFVKQKKPMHYMPLDSSTKTGGEYSYAGWCGVRFADFKEEKAPMIVMNGVDVASYQQGIDFSKVPCDFAIIKATEGVDYVNPACNAQYASAKGAGKLRGLYHYANGGDPEAEAKYFVDSIKNYVGSAILVLDWESYGNSAFGKTDVSWCKRWLDKVYALTGVRPLIYMSQSVVLAHDWSPVAKEYGLWLAQYVVDQRSGYKQDYTHGSTGAWQFPAIWQYTSGGYLAGWAGRLDLNVAYMDRTAWGKYAEAKTVKKEEVIPVPKTIKLGSRGKVVRMWQAFLGFTGDDLDGKFGSKKTLPETKKWQSAHGLTPDGVVGPKTWRKALESIA